MTETLVLATRNAHKLAEVARMLEPFGIGVEGLPDAVELGPEVGSTFLENARGKAVVAARALGRGVIADDSGIEAAALGGRPGVYSARYAGPDASDAENLAKLRVEAPVGSALAYVCVVVYAGADGTEMSFSGRCEGVMAADPAGGGGFGYDPIFVPDESDGRRTMAQLDGAEKDLISHRGRAVRAFAKWYVEQR